MDKHGWATRCLETSDGRMCLLGSVVSVLDDRMTAVLDGRGLFAPMEHPDWPYELYDEAMMVLLHVTGSQSVAAYNDALDSKAQALQILDRAIAATAPVHHFRPAEAGTKRALVGVA